MTNVTVAGCGYVGLVTSVVFAELGHQVIGVDVDTTKVAQLARGICPIVEPEVEELLTRNFSAGRLDFTASYGDAVPRADVVFICVGTPAKPNGETDMLDVEQAAHAIARHLVPGAFTVIVNKSTMPLGSGDLVGSTIREAASLGVHFAVVSNPEFLREGSAVQDMLHPARIVIGTSSPSAAEIVASLYKPMNAPLIRTDLRTAEMIKYAANAFLATRISFINEMAAICEALGADVRQVAVGMGSDERIGPYFLNAGIGFGGSCFPKDVQALERMAMGAGCNASLLRSVLAINQEARQSFVRKLEQLLDGLLDKTIAVWGLTFKPNTDDLRESPAIAVVRDLVARGARVRAYDPVGMVKARKLLSEVQVEFGSNAYDVATGADAVAVLTDWNEFKAVDLRRVLGVLRQPILLDGRNIFDREEVAMLGFEYCGVGVPNAGSKPSSNGMVDSPPSHRSRRNNKEVHLQVDGLGARGVPGVDPQGLVQGTPT